MPWRRIWPRYDEPGTEAMRFAITTIIVLGCWALALVCPLQGHGSEVSDAEADIEVFVHAGCPACKAARLFLDELQRERPALRLVFWDVVDDPAALSRLTDLAARHGVSPLGVPAFYVRGELLIGYLNAETTGSRLRALLDRAEWKPGEEASGTTCPPGTPLLCEQESFAPIAAVDAIEAPLLGHLSVSQLGLPAFTLVIGLLDGFNPCAMWMLLFLLSLLVNLQSRLKMLIVGGTFVAVSGLVYFAFMAAWLNIFLIIGLSRTVQFALGGIACLVGAINVKDFFAFQQGLSLSIPESTKPGVYGRVRRILQAENLPGAIAGVIVLAALVNTIELLCTAGLPALYTQILALQHLPWWGYYGYLGLYNLAYILDDSVMLTIAAISLSHRKLQAQEGRWLKLISGVVMLGLGLLLMAKPEWLGG